MIFFLSGLMTWEQMTFKMMRLLKYGERPAEGLSHRGEIVKKITCVNGKLAIDKQPSMMYIKYRN